MTYTGLTLEEAAVIMDGAHGSYVIAQRQQDGRYTVTVEEHCDE